MMNKRRVMDLVVVAAVAAVVGLVAGSYEPLHRRWAINLGLLGAYELTPLAERYKTRESFFAEEWIFRDFFRDQRDGFFVEIGAGPHQTGSNTYFLEKERGWRGIAVDALDVISNEVVHSESLGKNERYHTFRSFREEAPSEAPS